MTKTKTDYFKVLGRGDGPLRRPQDVSKKSRPSITTRYN